MSVKFSFFAYGILAVAALLFLLYFLGLTNMNISSESIQPFLYVGVFIVVMFIIYMFVKLARR